MKEVIKQWIADQAAKRFPVLHVAQNSEKNSRRNQARFAEGLTKGIEIAEGFADFLSTNYEPYSTGKWEDSDGNIFTNAALIEKFIKSK